MTVDELLEVLRDDGVHIIVGGYIRPHDFAALVDRNPRTLRRWRERKYGPPLHRRGRTLLYSIDEIAAFLSMSANVRDREGDPLPALDRHEHDHARPSAPCSIRRRSLA